MAIGSERVARRLAAIFAADVAGYSRLMGQDEVGTLQALTAHREIMDQLIGDYGGRIANTAGDSVLAEFPSAVDAVVCAVEVQKALEGLNEGADNEHPLRFRIGVHIGDVMIRGGDLLGDGVNIAARLQALADPGGVCVSSEVHRHVRKTSSLTFKDLGEQQVKNIDEPIRAFAAVLVPAECLAKHPLFKSQIVRLHATGQRLQSSPSPIWEMIQDKTILRTVSSMRSSRASLIFTG
jgi:adenylate cyclase